MMASLIPCARLASLGAELWSEEDDRMTREIEIELTVDDYAPVVDLMYEREGRTRQAVTQWGWILAILPVLPLIPAWLEGNAPKTSQWVTGGAVLAYCVYAFISMRRRMQSQFVRSIASDSINRFVGPRTIRIDERGLTLIGTVMTWSGSWLIVTDVTVANGRHYIWMDEGGALPVPRPRDMPEVEFEQFMDELRSLWQRHPSPHKQCPECGFDLTGAKIGGCPECGWRRGNAFDEPRP